MRFIHGGTIEGKVTGGAIVRVIFSSILLMLSILLFFTADDLTLALVFNIIGFWPGGFLLLFFGLRSLKHTTEPFRRHNISFMLHAKTNDPFFTTQCEHCALYFDYQLSDLGYRPWYPDGYVECPRCDHAIRHNAAKNIFHAEEIVY